MLIPNPINLSFLFLQTLRLCLQVKSFSLQDKELRYIVTYISGCVKAPTVFFFLSNIRERFFVKHAFNLLNCRAHGIPEVIYHPERKAAKRCRLGQEANSFRGKHATKGADYMKQ